MPTPLKVLMIEDSEDDALLLVRALRKGGFAPDYLRVETAEHMAEALREQPWQIVLCDFKLPRFSGLDALLLLNKSGFDIPLIIVSGTIGEETAVGCMRCGASDYIMKDNLSRLCPAIERELIEAQTREKNRRAQEVLQENQRMLKEAQEMARLGFWQWDVKTGSVAWSEQVYEIFHLNPDTFTPRIETILALSPWPEDHERDKELIRRATALHEKGAYEQRFLRPDGTTGYYYSTFQGSYDEEGRLVSIMGTVQDVTERKHAEEALQKSEEKFRTIANYTVDWESWFGPDGKYLWVNPAVERITGYSVDEVLAMPDFVAVMIAEEGRDELRRRMERARHATWGDNFEICCLHKNGSKLWLSISWQPVYDPQGGYLGIRMSGRDITARIKAEEERRNLEKQLFEAQKMESIGTLAGGIAHDFNNILAGIIGYAELAAMGANDTVRTYLDHVLNAADRAKHLIQQILAFSRHTEHEKKPIDLRSVVQEVLKLLRATISAAIEINVHLPRRPIVINADHTQMHQVIMNICTNAVHAMGEKGGTLEIELICDEITPERQPQDLNLAPGVYAQLRISDTGHGIDPVNLPRIFDPFFTTKKVGEGTGLGLAVVYGIIHDHGGYVKVASRLGYGAAFYIYLPLLTAKEIRTDHQEKKDVLHGNERILFVDDEQLLVSLGQAMLTGFGYTVTALNGSQEALRLYKANPDAFDLVITDMNMPHMTGRELAVEILQLKPDQRIILMTGYSDYIDSDKSAQLGIRAFAVKPLSKKNLALLVRNVLDSK